LQQHVASASIKNSPPLTEEPRPEALAGIASDCVAVPVRTNTS
jgi:hypothetical protein